MSGKIQITQDGSNTLLHPKFNAHYHSVFGALIESTHVYINAGLLHFYNNAFAEKAPDSNQISILEIGFGTGLNALNTLVSAEAKGIKIDYVGIEDYPVDMPTIKALDYPKQLNAKSKTEQFYNMHSCTWGEKHQISEGFSLTKIKQDFFSVDFKNTFNVVYYDAFGPGSQPELWTTPLFKKMYNALKPNGVLTTYCSQGNARRAMMSAGFSVNKLPGPPSKRHILRAVKTE